VAREIPALYDTIASQVVMRTPVEAKLASVLRGLDFGAILPGVTRRDVRAAA
jgi:hypothetical protein